MIIVFGPAGSGKTLLVKEFGDWLEARDYTSESPSSNPRILRTHVSRCEEFPIPKQLTRFAHEYKVARLNLDPGAEYLGYEPDFDIRNFFSVKKIMVEKNLGPNGAMLEAIKMMNENIDKIMKGINGVEGDYILIDTPGQNEIWLFQELNKRFVARLENSIGIFLMDSDICKEPKNLLLNLLFSLIIKLRFGISMVNIFNKIDLLDKKELSDLKKKFENPLELIEKTKKTSKGMLVDIIADLGSVIGVRAERFVGISCKEKKKFSSLHDIIYEVHCVCGDLT